MQFDDSYSLSVDEDSPSFLLGEMLPPPAVANKKRSGIGEHPSQLPFPTAKHTKLNCGATAVPSAPVINSQSLFYTSHVAESPIRICVQPRQKSIGLYSGVTKGLFCITVTTPPAPATDSGNNSSSSVSSSNQSVDSSDYQMKSQHIIILKIQSSASIRKVLHSRADRRGSKLVLVPLILEKHDHHEDILVQVVDLPADDLQLKVSTKIVNADSTGNGPTTQPPPITKTCTIARPPTATAATESPYVLAQLLLYAASRVLKDYRSQDLEKLHKQKKGRVAEVLRMIQRAPAAVQRLPEVRALEQKLKE